MSSAPAQRLTPEEYLTQERRAATRSEYVNGQIYAMTGASREHNLIAGNTFATLHAQLRSRACEVYASDMRVKLSATGMYTYPDVVAVCGVPQFEDEAVDTLLNPSVIVEVLSDSTERYDRGAKFAHYRTLDSLTDYLLIAQGSYLVEQYTRQPDGQWLFSANTLLTATLTLASIGCTLPLAAIYEKIAPPPDPAVPQHPTPRT